VIPVLPLLRLTLPVFCIRRAFVFVFHQVSCNAAPLLLSRMWLSGDADAQNFRSNNLGGCLSNATILLLTATCSNLLFLHQYPTMPLRETRPIMALTQPPSTHCLRTRSLLSKPTSQSVQSARRACVWYRQRYHFSW
jgi:hypothetical protein